MANQNPYTGDPSIQAGYAGVQPLREDADIRAFGGAQAEASKALGGALSQGGSELFARAIAMQQLSNQADALNAHGQFSNAAGEELFNFRQKSGQEAVAARGDFKDRINQLREEYGKNLNPMARMEYMRYTQQNQQRLVEGADIHAAEQFKHYLTGSYEASNQTSKRNVQLNPESDEVFQQEKDNLTAQIGNIKHVAGWSDGQSDNEYAKNVSDLVLKRVSALTESGKTGLAEKVLQEAADKKWINEFDYGEAKQKNHAYRINIDARNTAAELVAGQGYAGVFDGKQYTAKQIREAVAGVESSKNYDIKGPMIDNPKSKYNGQVGLGRYQVMQGNLQPWLAEAGMPKMSEDEFLHNKAAQDQLFDFKFGQYVKAHNGDIYQAMRDWRGHAKVDPTVHETEGQYAQKLRANLTAASASSPTSPNLEQAAGEIADQKFPGDVEYKENLQHRVKILIAEKNQIKRQERFDHIETIENGLRPGEDGKLITNIDTIQDQKFHDSWHWLIQNDPKTANGYLKAIANNAGKVYAQTDENQAEFKKARELLTSPDTDPEDLLAAINEDYQSKHWPGPQIKEIMSLRNKAFNNTIAKDPNVDHAMSVSQGVLEEYGFNNKKSEDYLIIKDDLRQLMKEIYKSGTTKINDEQIQSLTRQLLTDKVYAQKNAWYNFWSASHGPAFEEPVPEDKKKIIMDQFHRQFPGNPDPTDVQLRRWYVVGEFMKSKQSKGAAR